MEKYVGLKRKNLMTLSQQVGKQEKNKTPFGVLFYQIHNNH
jgi:hypothetical protein